MTNLVTWWNSSARDLVYARWGVLVIINTVFPLFLSALVLNSAPQFIGVALAIASFIVIYAEFDLWLIGKQQLALSKQLKISAAIKTGTPLLPFIDMFSGMVSIGITEVLTGFDLEKINSMASHGSPENLLFVEPSLSLNIALTYMTTMINGMLLSLLVGMILLGVRMTLVQLAKRRTRKQALAKLNSAAAR